MRNSWRHPAYLQKRSAVTERDGADESVVEVLKENNAGLCVVTCARAVSKSCRCPISWTYVAVKVSYLFLHFAASFIFCCYEPDLWKMEHVAFIYLSDRATVRQ